MTYFHIFNLYAIRTSRPSFLYTKSKKMKRNYLFESYANGLQMQNIYLSGYFGVAVGCGRGDYRREQCPPLFFFISTKMKTHSSYVWLLQPLSLPWAAGEKLSPTQSLAGSWLRTEEEWYFSDISKGLPSTMP